MGQVAEIIVACGRRARMYMEKMSADVDAAVFACQAAPGGQLVNANHPAWVYGHLALYPRAVLGFLGLPADAVGAPAGWEDLFSPGSACHHDPERKRYPARDVLVSACLRGYDAALEAVAQQPDSAFAPPTPIERYRAFLPTVGAAAMSMLNNHVMLHMGQISTWRRCMGLGAIQ